MPSIAPSTRWWVDTNAHSWHFRELPLQPSITCTGWDNHSWWFYASFLFLSLSQVLKNISWYTERSLTEISLGSLLILVVIRTIQFNMTRTRVRSCWSPSVVDTFILPWMKIYDWLMEICLCTLSRISTSTPTVWLRLPTCRPSSVVSTSTLPSVSSGEDIHPIHSFESKFSDISFSNVNIFCFFPSSVKVNWISLSWGQNRMFPYIKEKLINIVHNPLTFYRLNNWSIHQKSKNLRLIKMKIVFSCGHILHATFSSAHLILFDVSFGRILKMVWGQVVTNWVRMTKTVLPVWHQVFYLSGLN